MAEVAQGVLVHESFAGDPVCRLRQAHRLPPEHTSRTGRIDPPAKRLTAPERPIQMVGRANREEGDAARAVDAHASGKCHRYKVRGSALSRIRRDHVSIRSRTANTSSRDA